jgi:hypothetical protein
MADICHQYGSDLIASASGDLLTVSGVDETNQRLLKRYFTNPGDYIWHLDYGGGLLAMIGQPVSAAEIEAVIQQQTLLEGAVAQTPAPTVSVTQSSGNPSQFSVLVIYTSAATGVPIPLTFTVG